jgi:hypothetical protein
MREREGGAKRSEADARGGGDRALELCEVRCSDWSRQIQGPCAATSDDGSNPRMDGGPRFGIGRIRGHRRRWSQGVLQHE